MKQIIGIDRKIKRVWLDSTLDQLAQTSDPDQLRQYIDELLQEELPGKESRRKSVGNILRIWSSIPAERIRFRERAIAMLATISGQDRLWLHWGMTILAYPFFRDTAEVVGRLLSLQDDITSSQVQTRLISTWGDRTTTREAAQKILHTLVDWEVLQASTTKGHYLLCKKMTVASQPLQLWLLETLLAASTADEIDAQQILRLPEAFPFTFTVGVGELRRHDGFDVHREGLNMEKVALRKVPAQQPAKPTKKPKPVRTKPAKSVQPSLFDHQLEQPAPVVGKRWSLADVPFATPIAECATLAREGRSHACIALAQTIVESAVLLIWQVKLRKRKNIKADFSKALKALHDSGLVGAECKSALNGLWETRHQFLHLGPARTTDTPILEKMSQSSLTLINDLAARFFGYSQREDTVIPDHPEYWLDSGKLSQVKPNDPHSFPCPALGRAETA